MTVSDEKTPLLSHVVLVVPGEVVAVPEELVMAAALPGDPWKGLTNRELVVLARDPYWVRLRAFIFWVFWVCWLALLVAALSVAISSPRCPRTCCDNTTLPTTPNESATGTEALSAWTTLTVPS